jgi:hypothetical protein
MSLNMGSLVDYCLDSIRTLTDAGNTEMLVMVLYQLYLAGELESYEMTGMDKAQILSVIDDFRASVDRTVI